LRVVVVVGVILVLVGVRVGTVPPFKGNDRGVIRILNLNLQFHPERIQWLLVQEVWVELYLQLAHMVMMEMTHLFSVLWLLVVVQV
jgi:hypothetical protein